MRDILVVSQQDHYYAYLNSCPHTGASLDWQPNQFLDSSGTLIQCSTHGALFRIEDGLCIYGPCLNRSLTAIETHIELGELFILLRRPATTDSS
jgi:nitrite reductase/ring-hydroxylating ferredoxin subunit